MKTLQERFEEKIYYGPDGCWYWLGRLNDSGYGKINIGNRKVTTAHRIAMKLYKGVDPGKLCVLHSCDNPACVNPEHLRVGTHKENMDDRTERGTLKGETHGRAKLTNKEVLEIRASLEKDEILAHRYKCGQGTISKIRNRHSWRHI